MAKWLKRFISTTLSLVDIGELFASAYLFAATPSNVIEGFKKTGILDCDIEVFKARDFMSTNITGDNDKSAEYVHHPHTDSC